MKPSKEPYNFKQPNLVTLQADETTKVLEPKIPEVMAIHESQAVGFEEFQRETPQKGNAEVLSYLEIYRTYEWHELCRDYHIELRQAESKDTAIDFVNAFHERHRKRRDELRYGPFHPNEAQDQVLAEYTMRCQSIAENEALQMPEFEQANYFSLGLVLTELLQTESAKTDKEKRIKQAFLATMQVDQARDELWGLNRGYSSMSEEEQLAMMEKIAALMQEATLSREGAESVTLDANHPAIKEMLRLQKKMQESVNQDSEAIVLAETRYIDALHAMEPLLHSPDPDVFYMAKQKAENMSGFDGFGAGRSSSGSVGDSMARYLLPSQKLMSEIGISTGTKLSGLVLLPATVLYWCELGGDCSASGRLMTQYCLGLGGWTMHVDACGVSAHTFYENCHLTRGQKMDVALLNDWIQAYYGQK